MSKTNDAIVFSILKLFKNIIRGDPWFLMEEQMKNFQK